MSENRENEARHRSKVRSKTRSNAKSKVRSKARSGVRSSARSDAKVEARSDAGSPTRSKTRSRERAKARARKRLINRAVIALGIIIGVALLVMLTAVIVFQYYFSKTNYISDEYILLDDSLEEETLSADQQLEFESIEEQRQGLEVTLGDGDVYNILLIGLDLRAGETWNGNSDSMILVSINMETEQIILTSFMRDLYAVISGVESPQKLNYAHAKGGGPLLVQTIEEMYMIDIDNYASVSFYDMIEIIDSLGGVDLEITDEEASVANQYYIPYLAAETGVNASDYMLTGGYVHLNGLQAVAYARIRYTDGADYARTERQRKILSLMFEKMKELSVTELASFLNTALPCITHNIDDSTLQTLLLAAYGYLDYELVTNRVPYDGYYYTWNGMLVPDFEYTISMLHSIIYGTD